jgi:hypothetical protein
VARLKRLLSSVKGGQADPLRRAFLTTAAIPSCSQLEIGLEGIVPQAEALSPGRGELTKAKVRGGGGAGWLKTTNGKFRSLMAASIAAAIWRSSAWSAPVSADTVRRIMPALKAAESTEPVRRQGCAEEDRDALLKPEWSPRSSSPAGRMAATSGKQRSRAAAGQASGRNSGGGACDD